MNISDKSKVTNLLVTLEHSDSGKMGGIGSYAAEVQSLVGENVIYLLIDNELTQHVSDRILVCHIYIDEKMPEIRSLYDNYQTQAYAIYLVTNQILMEYEAINHIEFHEYAGLGAKIVEAKSSGLLYRNVTISVRCQGAHLQLERATGEWTGAREIEVQNAERTLMENADELWFSSRYLYDLYKIGGINMSKPKVEILGLPYTLSDISTKPKHQSIENLIFVGRMNRLKGYEVFCDLVESLVKSGKAKGIKRVVAIGKEDGSLLNRTNELKLLLKSAGIEYTQQLMARNDLLEYEETRAKDSLFVLPYASDNYSVAVLELIEKQAPVICLATGGTPELVSDNKWSGRVSDTTEGLIDIAENFIAMSKEELSKNCSELYEVFCKEQTKRNYANKMRYDKKSLAKRNKADDKYAVIIVDGIAKDNISASQFTLNSDTGNLGQTKNDNKKPEDLLKSFDSVFLCSSGLAVDTKVLDSAVRAHRAAALIVDNQEGELFVPNNSDFMAIINSRQIPTNAWVDKAILIDFLKIYSTRSRFLGPLQYDEAYFFISLYMYLASSEIPVSTIPAIIGTQKTGPISYSPPSEEYYFNIAQFIQSNSWLKFRALAHSRNLIQKPTQQFDSFAELEKYQLSMNRFHSRGGKYSSAVLFILRAQNKLISLAAKTRR